MTSYFPAYSRPSTGSKAYVQDRLLQTECKEAVLEAWYKKGGNFYICGDGSGMAKGVNLSLKRILAESVFNGDLSKADSYVTQAQTDNRYLEDVWG